MGDREKSKQARSKELSEDKISVLPFGNELKLSTCGNEDSVDVNCFTSWKSKQARSKRLSARLKEDMISELPDPLICRILCHLPTKDAVRTSILSTRWKSLWLWVPRLELDSRKFPDRSTFVSFGDRFFDSSRASSLYELKLSIRGIEDGIDVASCSWIDAAVKRKIQHLYVLSSFNEMPPSLYNCETMVSLELRVVDLGNIEFVSLPCLKTMRLSNIEFSNEATFEKLVSSCPVLEELVIERPAGDVDEKVFRVRSRSLKSLTFRKPFHPHVPGSVTVIDAPQLRFLSITDNVSEVYRIANMGSNVKLDLRLGYLGLVDEATFSTERNIFRSFLPGISKVRDMTISSNTFEFICRYMKSEPLPQFDFMSRLHVKLWVSDLKRLPTFLESFPNLKSLVVVCNNDCKKPKEICFSSVPECMLSSLEFVDFKGPCQGCAAEMKLVRYFLTNSAVVKKLTLRLGYSSEKDDILKKLLKIPRASTKCKVVVVRLSCTDNRLSCTDNRFM